MIDASEQALEASGADAVSIKRKVLIAWIATAAVAAATVAATAGYLVGHGEVSRLQHAVSQSESEKAAAKKQFEDLRLAYSQMIALQRCDVIDGLDDCLAAGLTRPPRFADSDRDLIEARRAQGLQRRAEENARKPQAENTRQEIKPETATEAKPDTAKPDIRQSAADRSKKLSLGEFMVEIKKIPGVGIDSGAQEHSAEDRKDKISR